jgi:uncharacterized protein (DUF433 family)
MTTTVVTSRQYVEEQEGCYRIVGKRISLDSLVYAYRDGILPEGIVLLFPGLTLEEVYGSIAFYLANRAIVDQYLAEGAKLFETLRQQARESDPAFYKKLHNAQTPRA